MDRNSRPASTVCGNWKSPNYAPIYSSFLKLTHNLLDLSAGVDVYSDWVDACDAVAKESANQYDGATSSQLASSKQGAPALAEADEDDY